MAERGEAVYCEAVLDRLAVRFSADVIEMFLEFEGYWLRRFFRAGVSVEAAAQCAGEVCETARDARDLVGFRRGVCRVGKGVMQ